MKALDKKACSSADGPKAEYEDAEHGPSPPWFGREMEALLGCSRSQPGDFHRQAVRPQPHPPAARHSSGASSGRTSKVKCSTAATLFLLPRKEWFESTSTGAAMSGPRPQWFARKTCSESHFLGIRENAQELLVKGVVFFVGCPGEVEFSWVYEELEGGFGGKLPRTHLAVSQGRISDYFWQKWVWKGLLLFTADPSHVMAQIEAR